MRPYINRLRDHDMVEDHCHKQHPEWKRAQHTMSKSAVHCVKIADTAPNHSCTCYADEERLCEGPEKCLVRFDIFLTRDHRSERSCLCIDPGYAYRHQGITDVQRHSHLACRHRAPIVEENGVEQLEDEIPAYPTYCDTPLKWPNFLPPLNPMLAGMKSQQRP